MSSRYRLLTACSLSLTPALAVAAQSTVAVSPFVSYVPSAATNPSAGFALTFGGTTGLALRAGGEMSLTNPARDTLAAAGTYRPWGADADAMLFLGGLGGGATVFNRSLSPYVFAGIGLTGSDSAGRNIVGHGWSYGAGANLPLGADASIFGEARWRLSEYVLPTSKGAPDGKSSWRFGLSFHVGGGSSAPVPRGRGRHHMADGSDVDYVVTPAPAPAPNVVVVQPAPAAEPEVVVVEREAAPAERVVVVERERAPDPVVIERERTSGRVVTSRESAPIMRRPPARVSTRRTVVVQSDSRTTTRVQGATTVRSSSRRPTVLSSSRQSVQRTTTRVVTKAPSATRSSAQASRPSATSSRSRRSTMTPRGGNQD